MLLFSQGHLGSEFHVPFWVVITCQAAMGLGTLFGGWRIVKTMGSKITRLTPMQGFCAETGGAITLFGATYLGVPVSTTHTITGCDHRRRRGAQGFGGALERRHQHRDGLDHHDAGHGADRGDLLLAVGTGLMSQRTWRTCDVDVAAAQYEVLLRGEDVVSISACRV